MKFGKKKENPPLPQVYTASRELLQESPVQLYAYGLFDQVRRTVPIVDAAISKLIRLIGSFTVECSDRSEQAMLDAFLRDVPVGMTGQSVYSFIDSYFDSLLIYGNAVGEMVLDRKGSAFVGLWNGKVKDIGISPGTAPMERQYFLRRPDGDVCLPHPERILFSALRPPDGGVYGVSLLQGLPVFADILLRIYECVGHPLCRHLPSRQ